MELIKGGTVTAFFDNSTAAEEEDVEEADVVDTENGMVLDDRRGTFG